MTVGWGFLGAGWMARTIVPSLRAARGADLVAVAARDPDRAAALGPDRTYGDYADLLTDDGVDAVYIALPNDAHLPWTLAALAAGKHVLCEKPLGLSAAQVDRMGEAAQAAGRQVVEASFYRWHPRVRLAGRLLAEGRIGPVRHVDAGFTAEHLDPGNYRFEVAHGGGALYDLGHYAISACLWAAGAEPTAVDARSTTDDAGVDLTTELLLEFGDGTTGQLRASLSEPGRQWLAVTGERGRIELPGDSFSARAGTDTVLELSDGRGTERIAVPAADPYRIMFEEVSSVLAGGPDWLLPLTESRLTAAVTDTALPPALRAGAGL